MERKDVIVPTDPRHHRLVITPGWPVEADHRAACRDGVINEYGSGAYDHHT